MSAVDDLLDEALVFGAKTFDAGRTPDPEYLTIWFTEWRRNMKAALAKVDVRSCTCASFSSRIPLPHASDCQMVRPAKIMRRDALSEVRRLGCLIAAAPIPEHKVVTDNVRRFAELVLAIVGEV